MGKAGKVISYIFGGILVFLFVSYFALKAYTVYSFKTAVAQASQPVAGMVWGDPLGNLTLVEFVDYRCSHCRVMNETLKQAVAGEPYVKIIIRPVAWVDPKESNDIASFVAAVARQGMGAELHDKILSSTEPVSFNMAKKIASELAIDIPKAEAEMKLPEVADTAKINAKMVFDMAGRSVPFLVIGDRAYQPTDDEQMRSVNKLILLISESYDRKTNKDAH